MDIENIINNLKSEFNDRISLKERRENIYQIFLPIYHEDGDMFEIFIQPGKNDEIRICDLGMTLMRLSYSYEIDTPNKQKIFNQILSQNLVLFQDGNIFIDTPLEKIYSSIMQLSQVISKVSNMKLYKREMIRSLFMEMLAEYIMSELKEFKPKQNYYPIEGHEEYLVDFCFNHRPKPIFLFGVPDSTHARLATISCLKFQNEKIPFRSAIVLEDLDNLGKKDQARLMSASDKEFPSLDDFKEKSVKFLVREINL